VELHPFGGAGKRMQQLFQMDFPRSEEEIKIVLAVVLKRSLSCEGWGRERGFLCSCRQRLREKGAGNGGDDPQTREPSLAQACSMVCIVNDPHVNSSANNVVEFKENLIDDKS
jgi:hypothetical protein